MDGILNINKPAGITSFGVVSLVKRLSGERRVGHAGTLDPAATGVLPVCLGQGTRVIEFLVNTTKAYLAEIELGMATDTYDATGRTTQQGDPSGISRARLDSALAAFHGLIDQIPPIYSALKVQGQPLYELARAGVNVELKSRPVNIHRLEVLGWQLPVVTVEVVCGRGTYIRSLAHDLGQALGCGAHLKSLVRLRDGIFDIKEAISLSQLEEAVRGGDWQRFLYPIDCVLSDWPAMVVSDKEAEDIKNGRPFAIDDASDRDCLTVSEQHHCRAYAPDGKFLGIIRFDLEIGRWRPQKVFLSSQ